MGEGFSVAVVGATGLVGEAMLDCLAGRHFPVGDLHLLAGVPATRSENRLQSGLL